MTRRRLICVGVVAAVLAAAVGVGVAYRFRPVPTTSGPLRHDAYVWQRQWTPAVAAAVRDAPAAVQTLAVLYAELRLPAGEVEPAAADFGLLRAVGRPVALVIRVTFPAGGELPTDARSLEALTALVAAGLREAAAHDVAVGEVQLDTDAPERQLQRLTRWLAATRAGVAVAGARAAVGFTALPSWLDRRAFGDLAAAADGYVLQVHGLTLPRRGDEPAVLCDPEAARAAVWRAARAAPGVPFRVALPTYSYLVTRTPEGKVADVIAEDAAAAAPGRVERVDTPAGDMAELVQAWTAARPMNMTGVVWFRLPTTDDTLNWPAVTLAAVAAGRTPAPRLAAHVRAPEPALLEVDLVNEGDAPAALPRRVALQLPRAPLAADALAGFTLRRDEPTRLTLSPDHIPAWHTLPPGAALTIAWVRMTQPTPVTELTTHVEANP